MTGFDAYSVVLVYSAMSVYSLALVVFAVELSIRRAPSAAPTRELALVGAPHEYRGPETAPAADLSHPRRVLRVAVVLLVLGWTLHATSTVLRGLAAGRLPWANMYEFALTGTVVITGVFLGLLLIVDLRYLGTFVTGLVLVLLGVAAVHYYVPVAPLPPALQSYWLVIHVFVALTATAFFAIGFALSATQLLRGRALARVPGRFGRMLASLPDATALENLAYRVTLVGFILWTFTLIAGAIWAERAWGRYWGWDTKEVWTFIVWVLYAGYIHARATRGWLGSRSAWLCIVGFAAVLFNCGVVTVFFTGLHSYSGL